MTLRVPSRGRRARLVVTIDARRPTAPSGVATAPSADRVALTWAGSRDDVAVAGYRVMRDGERIAAVGRDVRSYADTGVRPGGSYRYAVVAVDTVGRRSRRSKAAVGTIPAAVPGATPSTAVSPSGENLPLGNLPGWTQVFADDFTTNIPVGSFPSAVSDRWWAYNDGTPDTSGHGRYYPTRVISSHDGLMDFHLRTESGQPLVAAPLPKLANTAYGQLRPLRHALPRRPATGIQDHLAALARQPELAGRR